MPSSPTTNCNAPEDTIVGFADHLGSSRAVAIASIAVSARPGTVLSRQRYWQRLYLSSAFFVSMVSQLLLLLVT
jgi:hypothetical protein